RLHSQLLKLGAPAAFVLREALALRLRQRAIGQLPHDLLQFLLLGLQIARAFLTERLQLLSSALADVRLREDPLQTDHDHRRSRRSDVSRGESEHNGAGREQGRFFHLGYSLTCPLYWLELPAEGERVCTVAQTVSLVNAQGAGHPRNAQPHTGADVDVDRRHVAGFAPRRARDVDEAGNAEVRKPRPVEPSLRFGAAVDERSAERGYRSQRD